MFLDALLDTLIDGLKLLPFLFGVYLIIEFIEDRAEDRTVELINRAGRWGPVAGAALGVVPQCGFSAAVSNLYAGGLITRGTLLSARDIYREGAAVQSPVRRAGGHGSGYRGKTPGAEPDPA